MQRISFNYLTKNITVAPAKVYTKRLFGGLRNRLVLNTHALRILVVHLLVYVIIDI